ncbi:MAG: methylmalonyl-CoA epimerase [Anaerolineales bacterium]
MTRIDHVGIAVEDIQEAARLYTEGLDIELCHIETVEDQGVKVGFLPLGSCTIELLEPLDDDGPVARFLARRGEGIHHLCVQVSDIGAVMERLQSQGVQLLSEQPVRGAGESLVAFVHPRSANGVLLELRQQP